MSPLVPSAPPRARGAALAVVVALAGCRSDEPMRPDVDVTLQPPAATATEPLQLPGLHNVVTYAEDLLCGGVPEGAEGMRTLAAMGVRTIVSVDGATPDVASASALGMRYVHLPISYDTVTPARQTELAQALASLARPIYVHCHHGQHRSAAGLATGAVRAGLLTPEQALERMGVSGTAKSYEGLWAAVREAAALPVDALRREPASFPSVATVTGMVATMAEIDQVLDLVKQAREADWQAPSDHPDLVATNETKRLATLFSDLEDDDDARAMPADFQRLLRGSIALTASLDRAVRDGRTAEAADLLATIGTGCKQCHRLYRDR